MENQMQNQEIEIDLMRIFSLLLRNAWIIALCTVIMGGMFFICSKKLLPVKYTSHVSLYVMNNDESQTKGEIILSDISASQKLVDTYSVILKDDMVMEEIGKKLIKKYGEEKLSEFFTVEEINGEFRVSSAELSNSISLSAVDETEILSVKATTEDPELSADVCNAMVEVAPKVLKEVMGVAYVNPIGYAKVPMESSSPNNKKNALMGGVLGFLLACAFYIIRDLISNTVDDAETLSNRFGISVLAEIPNYTDLKGENRNV